MPSGRICSQESQQKKKQSKGNYLANNPKTKGVNTHDSKMAELEGKSQRPRHKIWFSKNHRPDKNLSLKKVIFNQEIIPRKVAFAPLGFSGFEMGSNQNNNLPSNGKTVDSHMSKLDSLFEHLVTRKDKLRDIVANINTTDANAALKTSILSMKSYKLLKFSAKVNEEGKVIIDDKMIETDENPEVGNATSPPMKQTSYANMLSGFILVRRRKGSERQPNREMGNRKPEIYNPNNRNQSRVILQNRHRDRGNHVELTYDRNIVNKPSKEGISEKTGHEKDQNNQVNNDPLTVTSTPVVSDNLPERETHTATSNINSRKGNTDIRMVETNNRFVLLDNDDQVIDGEEHMEDIKGTTRNEPEDKNDGWRKKQERIVNAKFRDTVTQDQRFMMKRYILDSLVPLDSTISEWSKPMLDYFRHMCSIHEFGEGTIAVSRERLNAMNSQNTDLDIGEEEPGEVESETDGTADLMKTDGPILHKSKADEVTSMGSPFLTQLTDGIKSANDSSKIINGS
ncbi:hypothetical protein L1987_21597 [Smallanthus sonchifolius]|uniref:Uncharacterized protein n=1 Tax=Smallanthus sonchifolius TaxID=185202 RepID=A0ACB9ICN8_9ASTR|nr:hypothetical protein L1987_21597 [Smallanthus sonchifolius]